MRERNGLAQCGDTNSLDRVCHVVQGLRGFAKITSALDAALGRRAEFVRNAQILSR